MRRESLVSLDSKARERRTVNIRTPVLHVIQSISIRSSCCIMAGSTAHLPSRCHAGPKHFLPQAVRRGLLEAFGHQHSVITGFDDNWPFFSEPGVLCANLRW